MWALVRDTLGGLVEGQDCLSTVGLWGVLRAAEERRAFKSRVLKLN